MNTPVSRIPSNPTPIDRVPPIVKSGEANPSPNASTTVTTAVVAQQQMADQTGSTSRAIPYKTNIVLTTRHQWEALRHQSEAEELSQKNDQIMVFLNKLVFLIKKTVYSFIYSVKDRFGLINPEQLSGVTQKLLACFDKHGNFGKQGIFRASGNQIEVDALRKQILRSSFLAQAQDKSTEELFGDLILRLDNDEDNANFVVANVLKHLFSKMQLFKNTEFNAMNGQSEQEVVNQLERFVGNLPRHQQEVLKQMMNIFGQISSESHSETSLMTSQSLAVVFAPNLFQLNLPLSELLNKTGETIRLTKILIDHRDRIFR